MNTSFYISMKALRSDQQNPSSSPPQYRAWAKVWLTLSFLGILLIPPVQAQTGAALNFDGADDYVSLPTAGLSPSAGTIELWVNTVSNGTTQMYVDLYQEQFTIYSTGTTLRARIAGTDLSAPFTPNQWNHLALTWSGNGSTARLYLNGVQVASGTQGSTPIGAATGYLSRSQAVNQYLVNSTMDEVRFWSVARAASEIAANYCSEVATNATGLQTYYKFSQGTVDANNTGITTLTDATSNGHNGTLVNFGLTGSASNWVGSHTWAGFVTPSVSIAGNPSGSILLGTSVTFTATPTHGGTTPQYQWKKNGTNIGTNSTTYTDATLANNDEITCILTSNATCAASTTATSNSVTMSVTYPVGAALNFDGTNDYATAPAGVYFNGNLTIEAWVYPKSFGSWSRIIDFGNGAGVDNVFLALSNVTSGRPQFNIGGVDFQSTQALTLNQWNHVAATLNGTTGTIYINGIAAGTATLPIPANVVRNNCYIGKSNWPDAYADVVMDELRIWSRALPQCEIQNNMNCELGSGQTSLTAYYKFNQGFGLTSNAGITSLTDASGNNRHATLNNFGLTGTTSNWVSTGGVTTGTTCTAYIAPSVSIAGSPSGTITYGTSVTFTATPTNGGTTPTYQWKKNGTNIGTNSTTYTDAALANGDVITCVLTNTCNATATSNSVTMTVTYPAGAALHFDGIDDYVSTNYDLNRTELTLEAWVYPQSNARMYVISNDLPSQNGAGFGVNNNLLEIDAHNQFINVTSAAIPNNQWTHIAVVYNPDGKIRAYVNGTEVYNTTVLGWTTSLNGSTSFLIGKHNQSETYPFNGKIDEVRVWNRSLPQCEIQNNRGCELGATQTGLAAYYKFNQGFGFTSNAGVTSLTDASSNNLTGTLTNFGLTGTTSNWGSTGGVITGTTCTILPTPSVSIAGSPSGSIVLGTSVTFTATPTNGGTTPTYQWKKNGTNVGTNSATYTDAALANADVMTCVMISTDCTYPTTATSNSIMMTVTYPAGAALNFDGTNDYVDCTNAAALQLSTGTIEAWIKTSNAGGGLRGLVVKQYAYGLFLNDNTLIAYDWTGNSVITTNTNLADGLWHHVAMSFQNGVVNGSKIYIDGVLKATTTYNISNQTYSLALGAGGTSVLQNFNGSIDEVRVWSRSLPQCEIQNNMSCELGASQTGLAAYYKFNQGFGLTSNAGITSLIDASGNSLTATLTNFGLTGTTSNWVSTGGVTTGTTCTALPTPSVAIAGSPSGSITFGTSVTFTATPTNGGTTPTYQWKKNGTNVGTNSATYTDAALANADVMTCVMTSNTCTYPATATSNSVTMTVTYPAGAALHFDGTNDYVEVAHSTSLNNYVTTGEITVEYWIKPIFPASGNADVIAKRSGNNGFVFEMGPTGLTRHYFRTSNNTWAFIDATYTSNVWQHIAITVKTNSTISAYVNGVLASTTSMAGFPAFVASTSVLRLMANSETISTFQQGAIDEVRLWNRTLPQCEIQNNMNCELGSGQTGLMAYYKFNQGFGFTSNTGVTTLTDASGNNNTGTLTNLGLTGATSNWVSTGGVTIGTTCTPLPTPSVVIAITAGSQTTCANTSVTFTATPTNGGTTPTYQWKRNGTNLIGATNATFTSTKLINNDVVTCELTSNAVCATTTTATSNSLTMTVTPTVTPSVSIAASATNVPEGTSVTFTATPTNGGTTPTYQWQKGGVNISGATNATYTSTTLANGDVITCVLTSNAICASAATTTSNGITMTVTAPLGAALDFDGVNDYVQFSNTGISNSAGTTELWIKNGVTTAPYRMFFDLGGESFTVFMYYDNMYFRAGNTQFSTPYSQTNTWTHIALVWNGPGKTFFGYINGVLVGSGTQGNVAITGTSSRLGQTTLVYDYPFKGSMDEVRLWNRALQQCEIQNNKNCELGSGQTGLSAYYKFNQGLGNTNNAGITSLTDASGNNRNGTLTNFGLTGTTSNWIAGGGVTTGTTCTAVPTPSVSIAASATTITGGTSVTFTATPTNGGTTPFYQWKKNNANIGTNSATYSDAALINGDIISCVMTISGICTSSSTATSNNITMTVTGGVPATALNFDGVDDYVTAPAGVYFNGDLTIEAWVYPKSFASYSRIIDFGNGQGGNNIVLSISEASSGKPVFYIHGQGTITANKALTLNQWNHVAVTLKGTLGTLYMNGVAVGTGTYNTAPANVLRNNCYIGKSNWAQDAFTDASLDELRIWNRALPQCEIQNNMKGELGSGQTSLLAYYKFNQGSVNTNNAGITTLTDASGNDRNATLNGFGLTGTSSNWVPGGGVAAGTNAAAYTAPSVSVSNVTACINTAATLTATATGFASTVTYQWETSADNITWSAIAGATTTMYAPATSTAGTRYFRLKATDACGVVYATGATFTVTNPGLTVTADATQVCQNTLATLTAATTTGTPTYQWQSSADGNTWADVSGATATTFAPATSTLGTSYYRAVATYGSGCTLNSTAQTLTVTAVPTASATGGNVTVGLGSTAGNLTAVINSSFASVFQWQSSADGSTGWTDIANTNVLTYTPSTESVGTLYYRLKVTFAATESVCNATIYSNSRKVTVENAPTVTISPTGGASQRLLAGETIACAGTNLTLTSSCTDATATPSWTGPNGFTASTANITLSNLTPAQTGKYRVIYLTATGYIGEQTTTVTVRPTLGVTKTVSNPSITSGSSSQIVVTGKYSKGVVSKIKFGTSSIRYLATRSAAIGSSPVYEITNDNSINQDWLFIPVAGGTVNFSASSSQKYYIQSVHSGLYLSASATNSAIVEMGVLDNSTRFEWTLASGAQNILLLRNGNQSVLSNSVVRLVSSTTMKISCFLASATPTMTLAWNDGPTATTRTVSPTATTNYIATFTNSAGCSLKDTTTITVVPSTSVSITPTGNTPPEGSNQQRLLATNVCQNQPISLSATVSNNGNAATYQWQRSTNGTTWFDITGVTSLTYSPPTNNAGTFFYRVIVTNSLGIFTSDPAEIFVIAVPTISIATTQATVCPNATPTLTAGYTTGFGTPTIQWQSSPDSTAWTNISGAVSETYQPVTTTAGKIYYRYIATFTGSCPTFTSKGVAITVKPVLTVGITGAATQTVCQGSYRFFTLSSNDATATFAWQNSTNGTTWATIANATSASYVAPTSTAGVTYYRGIVSAAGCSATSDTRQITTSAIPTVTVASPYSETCVDRPVSFTATLSSTSAGTPTFVWQTSNNNLNWATKATGSTYSPSAATVGSTYVRAGVKFASCTDSIFSVPKTLLSQANPIVTVSVNPTAPCNNVATVLTANLIGGSSSPTYQWQKTSSLSGTVWSNISGATSSSYTLAAGTASNKYRVQVQYNTYCPVVLSQAVTVTPKTAPSVTIAASGTAICQGSTVSLTSAITNGVANQTLQWQSSPDGTTWTNIAGATTASYSYTAATVGSTRYRLVVSVNGCSEVNSAATTIAVSSNTVPTLAIAANNSTVCGATEIVVTATPANLNGVTPQYEWLRNGELFTGQPSSFVTKSTVDGLGSNAINDIAIVGKKIYVATNNGLSISLDGGVTFTNKTTANGLPSNKITALGVHPNGISIVIGTDKGPVASLNSGSTFLPLKIKGRPIITPVSSIGVVPNGSKVFVSCTDKYLYDYDFSTSTDVSSSGNTVVANSINFKDNTNFYFWTASGMTKGQDVGYMKYVSSAITALPYKRAALRGDTIFATNSTTGFNYFINNVQYSVTGLPAASTIQDVLVMDNIMYVTATSGLYVSKDGGKSFSDITSSVGLGSNPGLGRIVRSGSYIYLASNSGLRIASATSPTLTFTANKSDLIECRMTTAGVCTNTISQSLTVNYIGDVDPTSINVAVEGTTGTGTWTAVNNASGYGWELMKYSPDRSSKTFVKNGTVTTNSVTLSDLNPSSNYELTVKTVCNVSTAFARLVDAPGTGAGVSTGFTTGFVVPQVIKDSLLKASTLCAEDELVLGPGFPSDYQVNIYSGTDKSFIDYASAIHPFRVRLTADIKYFYKVVKFDVKTYTFTASNNDAGSESKRYTVPAGVSQITFKVAGSKGGGTLGGNGGVTTGSVTPTAGATYYLFPGTTTTADAGISRGTSTSANGGGGSYVSTTSLRTNAILVAGGGGGGSSYQSGGKGGLIGGIGYSTSTSIFVTGGNATAGGASFPATGWATMISQRTASGFMKGSSTNNVTATQRKGDYGGGGGYYGGGSSIDMTLKQAGGGGGSSYVNTAVVSSVLYENGTNPGTGYVTVNEYYQVTANSDFLPLDIVRMPVPALFNQLVTVTPNPVIRGSNFQASVSLTGNTGFSTTYKWNNSGSQTTQSATYVANGLTLITCEVSVAYCANRVLVNRISKQLPFYGTIPPDSSSNRGNRLLTPSVSIASSATNICGGEQVIFTATPTNVVDENLFYTWRKNGEDIIGQSDNVLQTSSLSNGDVITCTLFYPTATGEIDSAVGTNSVTMTVATPATPKVTIATSANDVCPGTAITFTPTPTNGGTSPLYRWYLNGDLVQTSPTYTSSSFENSDYVECIMASNAACLAQTESEISTSVSVNLKPTVTPTATVYVSDTLICAGSPTSLTVRTEDAGTTPQYQWRHNGAPVGNNADYFPTSVSNNDAIWCEVTASADACTNTNVVQSNTELIQTAETGASFMPLATITVDKDSICTGDSLTFSVEGNYLGNTPQYVWKKNGTTLDGTDASITLATIANGDIITCVTTSNLGCVASAEATSNALTAKVVTPATPTVSVTTENTTICPNIPVVIAATPSYGGLLPQYNWRLNGNAHNTLPNEFFNYTTENGLGSDYTNAVFVRNDTVYAATAGGVSYRVKGDSIYSLSYDKGLATSNVQAIYVDDSGVYAGTDAGLSVSTDGLVSFRPINTVESGLSSGNITAITAIGSTLFVGTDNGLNISTDGGSTFTTKKTTNGLASDRIRHLFVDGTTLYVGTEGGLNITTNNGTTFTSKTIADSLNSDTVLGIWAKGAAIYAATQQGLAVSNDGGTTFTKLTMENGLPNLQVNSVWVVGDSMVYAATSGGLGISKNGGKTFRGYYETDTLGSNTVLGVTVASGRIYAATTGGLSISDPSKIRVYPNDGDVFATSITSNKSCVATSTVTSNNLTFFVGTVSAASLAATSVKNTSATLTWTGTTGSYNWLVVPTGTGLDGTIVASGTTTTMPITATGLTVLTTYDLFVQGACTPDGTVDWVGPLTFTTTNNAFVSVKTLLHGAYDATTGLMNDNLRSLNLVPTTEPYTSLTGFTHVNGGGEKTSSTVFAVTGNDAIVDWVFVELRDKTTPTTVIATRSALIQRDGDVVDVDGVSPVSFNVSNDDYYISVRHRNHLGVRTASAVTLDKVTAAPYDFTTAVNKALNSIQKDLTGGKFGMYAGNINGNNTVQASGSLSFNDYLNLIGLLGGSSGIQTNVYSVGDVNMDGTMRASGSLLLNDYLKIINAIGSAAGVIEQPF